MLIIHRLANKTLHYQLQKHLSILVSHFFSFCSHFMVVYFSPFFRGCLLHNHGKTPNTLLRYGDQNRFPVGFYLKPFRIQFQPLFMGVLAVSSVQFIQPFNTNSHQKSQHKSAQDHSSNGKLLQRFILSCLFLPLEKWVMIFP